MPTPEEEAKAIRDEFIGVLENFYQGLPEGRKKFMTDKRLQEFDITVARKKPKEKTPDKHQDPRA